MGDERVVFNGEGHGILKKLIFFESINKNYYNRENGEFKGNVKI